MSIKTSEDLIKRSDAITAVAQLCAWHGSAGAWVLQEDVIEALENVTPNESKQEWIPCSERLPKENGRYLVTFPSLINKPWIDILWYGRPTFPETDHSCFYASDDEYGDVEYDDVVAWALLPEPYGEREGE